MKTSASAVPAVEYQICTRTVMDTSDPEITFDENGVSNYALMFDEHIAPILSAASAGERQMELDAVVARIKRAGRSKPYDCVIGVSGGIDSSYLILRAVELGLRPLAVHFDSGWNSELAVGNIHAIVERLGLDLVTDVVDWREMRDLQLSFFKASVPNCDIPTDHAFPAIAYREASKYGIRYILSGHNLATESILPGAWGYNSADAVHVRGVQRRFGTVPLKTYPTMGLFKRQLWYGGVRGIASFPLLNYMPYDKEDAKRRITEELGWRDYGGKHHESVFTRYFQGCYLPEKFGFDKRRAHLSSLILAGQLTREEALAELEKPTYDPELQRQDHAFIAKKLGVTPTELDEIFALPPRSHLEYPNAAWAWRHLWEPVRFVAAVMRKLRLR